MTWVKLDDGFPEGPKVIGLTDRAFRVHVRALCYSSQHLTDGFVPQAKAVEWGSRQTAELLAAALWEVTEAGYLIHDFLDYNPSAESVKNERRKARERRSNGGRSSGERRANVINPDPTRPEPDPKTPKAKAPTAITRPTEDQTYLAAQITEAWGLSPQHLGFPALQRLNSRYGVGAVTSAMRSLHGFPPEEAVQTAYAYIESICQQAESA